MADLTAYRHFVREKFKLAAQSGVPCDPSEINPILKPHQRDIVRWAVEGGQRAIFASFGLGKTMMQLEICRILQKKSGGRTLVILPLGVRQEFRRDAEKLGIDLKFVRRTEEVEASDKCHFMTNYESARDGKLSPDLFTTVCLDEASVLRSYGSKTYQQFLPLFAPCRYKFVATATPAPNRYKELIHYAGFLGIMDTGQALAQPLTSNALTPTGWAQIGSLKTGDYVIGRNGKPTEILGVYPQGEKDIFKVTFSDGATTRATAEHLWLTRTQYQRNAAAKFSKRNPDADDSGYWAIKETSQIASTLICESTGSKNHQIPMVEPVEFDSQEVSIDPYLLGFLIGDGCLRPTCASISTADSWVVDRISEIVSQYGLSVHKILHERADGEPNYDYRISAGRAGYTGRGNKSNVVLNGLREYELIGKRSWERRIPAAYLFNTIDTRLSVLQGLMDADGTISTDIKNRTTRLTTTSAGLAEDVEFIARSLGGTSHVREQQGRKPSGDFGRLQYVVTIRLPNGLNPFRLPRKADLVLRREKYKPARYIVSVEPDGKEEAQCIAIADSEHLYVTDDFIVTHNTRFFQRDSTQANHLTLYPHKEKEFWLWLHSWAIFIQRPSELGYSDEGYDLPEIKVFYHKVEREGDLPVDRDGQVSMFFEASLGLREAAREKRASMAARIEKMKEILADDPDSHYILWHDLEAERHAIKKAVPAAVEVYGSLDLDERERRILDFSDGRTQYLATKPEISGSGCNFQRHCHKAIFLGIGYKFNDFIQSIHRIHRFLQDHPCEIHVIYSESEAEVLRVLLHKWEEHKRLMANMSVLVERYGLNKLSVEGLARDMEVHRRTERGALWEVALNDCVEEAALQETDSVGLVVTSIPFSNHYEYTPNYCDFGHTEDNGHFWRQMDFLTPEILRILRPGRLACIHVKDRVLFGSVTGAGVPTISPLHAEAIFHHLDHGFDYMGMITVITDVVRENNQTYRLGWSENSKDGTKMGVGSPEYVLLFRKPQTDRTRGYADDPVSKPKDDYSRARWQVDAHAFWRSSGDRLLSAEEFSSLPPGELGKAFREASRERIYEYNEHVSLGEDFERRGRLPATYMAIAPGSWHSDVWDDVNRMLTLNGDQTRRGLQNHICPLQFDIVDRLIIRYSNEGDLVYDPFAGLMTVPYRAIMLRRRGGGSELSEEYFRDGVRYLRMAETDALAPTLFDLEGIANDQRLGSMTGA